MQQGALKDIKNGQFGQNSSEIDREVSEGIPLHENQQGYVSGIARLSCLNDIKEELNALNIRKS